MGQAAVGQWQNAPFPTNTQARDPDVQIWSGRLAAATCSHDQQVLRGGTCLPTPSIPWMCIDFLFKIQKSTRPGLRPSLCCVSLAVTAKALPVVFGQSATYPQQATPAGLRSCRAGGPSNDNHRYLKTRSSLFCARHRLSCG